MKLNLLHNSSDLRHGYINIDASSIVDNSLSLAGEKRTGDIKNLNWVCQDGQATEIVAIDSPMSIPYRELPNIVHGWVKKLAPGGIIAIGGNEIYEACKAYELGNIVLNDLNEILYGSDNKTALSLEFFVDLFLKFGLTIRKKEVQNYKFIVIGQK